MSAAKGALFGFGRRMAHWVIAAVPTGQCRCCVPALCTATGQAAPDPRQHVCLAGLALRVFGANFVDRVGDEGAGVELRRPSATIASSFATSASSFTSAARFSAAASANLPMLPHCQLQSSVRSNGRRERTKADRLFGDVHGEIFLYFDDWERQRAAHA